MRTATLVVALAVSAATLAAGIAFILAPGMSTDDEPIAGQGTPADMALPDNFGVIVNTPGREASILELNSLYAKVAGLGATRSNVYVFWNALEPSPREYAWAQTDAIMTMHERHDLAATLFFSLVNGRTLGPLPDWMGHPTLDAIPPDDVSSAIGAILARYPRIDTVVMAGEADSHFERYPGMLDAYNDLFEDVRDDLAAEHPDVMVGNAISLDRIINRGNERIVSDLAAGDFVAFTYRPLNLLNEVSRTPQDAIGDMETMLRITGGQRVALLEAGWSSSADIGGDPASQAEFAVALSELASSEPRLEFVTWYRLHDRPDGSCTVGPLDDDTSLLSTDGGTYAASGLGSYICGAGLLDVDGAPKPAWGALGGR